MSSKRQLFKARKKLFKKLRLHSKQSVSAIKKSIIWLLRNLFVTKKRRSSANAGFVLPTVAMVALVVVLLTTAILFRSFERAKNASNVRVNEVALNAAAPALDRARAKINKLFQDPRLPRATPTDDALYNTLDNYINEYTFGDETQLKLTQGSDELRTAWMYPIDTDNNGKFDSYALYGIYFKNPPVSNGQYTRARNSLEARTPPMTIGTVSSSCGDGQDTSAVLVGNTGWFRNGARLKKAFFVYTASVPITTQPTDTTNYEKKKGSQGFSAIELQQDRVQLPLVNNAVVYEDDLGIAPGPAFRLNGRIFANSNLLAGLPTGGNGVRLYQVSGNASCFYDPENAKIIVGGNLGSGVITENSDTNGVSIDLYKGKTPAVSNVALRDNTTNNKSVARFPRDIAYNSLAYTQRINRLVNAQMANDEDTDPSEVTQGMRDLLTKQGRTLADLTTVEKNNLRFKQLELYFTRRTRRVPYAEVAFGGDALGDYNIGGSQADAVLQGSGNTLRPPDAWIYPVDPADGLTATGYAGLSLNTNGSDKLNPAATEPTKLAKQLQGVEGYFGDRVLIGNNLPQLWWDKTKEAFVGPNADDTQTISNYKWDNGDGDRTRRSRVETLKDLGSTERDKDWELAAAQVPNSPQEPVGGLRVVTGAGIYLPDSVTPANLSSTTFTTLNKQIWPDLLPVKTSSVPSPVKPYQDYGLQLTYKVNQPTTEPYLRMRATAVYHYKSASYSQTNPTPIACVSSYYDPTNSTTAKNPPSTPETFNNGNGGLSNNGIVYDFPTAKTESSYSSVLSYLADLTYPNGRSIDDGLLRRALNKADATKRTLSEKSAIDAAICGLAIFDGTLNTPTNSVIEHGSIYEVAFLDARQIQATDVTPGSRKYDFFRRNRTPLEIRATVLDIDKLRRKTIGNSTPAQEYLLPNSGIIYATRDDALLDLSAAADPNSPTEAEKLESAVDYKLDPNRRPNAIMLVNGQAIARNDSNAYRDAEKGLILATNLPAYIKGNFNLHTQEEFNTALTATWDNFYSRTGLNTNFACRPGDPRLPQCTTGDQWRSAAVLADSLTVLSNNFRFGFRNEGDYDWQLDTTTVLTSPINYTGIFSTVNSYAPIFDWVDPTADSNGNFPGFPKDLDTATTGFQGSSYLNNFVTPIVRKIRAKQLLLEVCYASSCGNARNWTIKNACPNQAIGQNSWRDKKADGTADIVGQPATSIKTGIIGQAVDCNTTQINPNRPTRIAFVRNLNDGTLVSPRKVYGVGSDGKVAEFDWPLTGSNQPIDALKDKQPYFIPWLENEDNETRFDPVFQHNRPFGTREVPDRDVVQAGKPGNWLQEATETTVNVIAAVGDTPAASPTPSGASVSRDAEDNGGLPNFVRLLENWNTAANPTALKMNGAFYQVKRSAYATAPFMPVFSGNVYQIDNYGTGIRGTIPYYLAPLRQWGYDVGLLSQSPDLFAQKLVTIPDDLPDEFFREVGRDDPWVKTLLCAKKAADNTNAIDADQRGSCS
ncbi:hormogonium polysaccharide biosynthesis protein HpsA [Anabaena sp. 4-3]|uniref:hormogonium polysaccharide biosynthesis protein HpsA n=1 Tax=Anabaena sp. 4-3 TaxID=1811979 RepID=UPI00082ADA01|nr:hormogonium polysaccharide biosynthesis protein HpsA [Anabaena sp. 4-3]